MSEVNKTYFVDFGPELLKLLGPNLYTNIYYVLGEIIANSYDADADNVYIIYNTSNNSIIIEDDGDGMSYSEINEKFLPIGVSSREKEDQTFTPKGRRKMGRKGIGKLAALSVSRQIKVTSIQNGEKSGCILSLDISEKNEDGKYEIPAIPDNEIHFSHIEPSNHGSAIIMEKSRYALHKSIESVKRNIALIFPFACKSFKIHLENTTSGESAIIDDFVKEIFSMADSAITFCDVGSKYNDYLLELHNSFDAGRYYRCLKQVLPPEKLPKQKELNVAKPSIRQRLILVNNYKEEKTYDLVIEGWIATYASTKDKKRNTDFPVNFISVISNDKLGQFDILPDISTDRMTESYVVGQFYVDLLEATDLPDIAASNRQGYKEDDVRFTEAKELIKKNALRSILELKKAATDEKNHLKYLEKQEKLERSKQEFDIAIKNVVENSEFKKAVTNSEDIKINLEKSWELKDVLKGSYKKVMISHDSADKELIDELEKILHFCGFAKDEIIYTSSDYYESGIVGAYTNIYDYLQNFFVNTTRHNNISVIYVLSDTFIQKWNPILEAGAGWVLDSKRFPIFINKPENILSPFERNEFTPCLKFGITEKQAHYLASALYKVCLYANKNMQNENTIFKYIESTRFVEYK